MKTRFCFSVLCLCALFLFGFDRAAACTCGLITPCEAAANADAVFVGTVLDFTERQEKFKFNDEDAREFTATIRTSRLRVEEAFFGVENGKEAFVETDVSTTCGLPLNKNEKYLIYARRDEKSSELATSVCSRTKSVDRDDAKEDLNYLRSIPENFFGTTVSGSVSYIKPTDLLVKDESDIKRSNAALLPLGVTTVVLENDERRLQTRIAKSGAYRFKNVPKGKYKLRVVAPETVIELQEINVSFRRSPQERDLPDVEVSGHGCASKYFSLTDNGRIGGRVTDADGKPVRGITVAVVPVAPEMRKQFEGTLFEDGLSRISDANGNYEIKGVPAGKYFVGVRLSEYLEPQSVDAAFPTTYFPGVASESSAAPITVGKGKSVAGFDFKLQPRFAERLIKGQVFFADGRPAAKVRVKFIARTPDFKDDLENILRADENGRFSVVGYENHAYLIGAFTDESDGNKFAGAIDVEIAPNEKVEEIKLVLDQFDGCPKCRSYENFPKQPNQNQKNKQQ